MSAPWWEDIERPELECALAHALEAGGAREDREGGRPLLDGVSHLLPTDRELANELYQLVIEGIIDSTARQVRDGEIPVTILMHVAIGKALEIGSNAQAHLEAHTRDALAAIPTTGS